MFGTAVDYGLTFLASLVLSSGSIVAMVTAADPAESQRLARSVFQDPTLAAALAGCATLATFAGALVAARLAHARPFAHALGVGLVGVTSALLDLAAGGSLGLPEPYSTIGLAAALPAAALGGLVGAGAR